MNDISMVGVPWGTQCSNIWLVFFIYPNNINRIHIHRASVGCLVLVKMSENRPKKLFVEIMRNSDVRMNEFPLFSFPFLRIVFISWCSLFINKFTIILFCEGINPLNPELNPICYLLALLGAHHFLHVSRISVKSLTLRLLMS